MEFLVDAEAMAHQFIGRAFIEYFQHHEVLPDTSLPMIFGRAKAALEQADLSGDIPLEAAAELHRIISELQRLAEQNR